MRKTRGTSAVIDRAGTGQKQNLYENTPDSLIPIACVDKHASRFPAGRRARAHLISIHACPLPNAFPSEPLRYLSFIYPTNLRVRRSTRLERPFSSDVRLNSRPHVWIKSAGIPSTKPGSCVSRKGSQYNECIIPVSSATSNTGSTTRRLSIPHLTSDDR
jgi:hypothetical protein